MSRRLPRLLFMTVSLTGCAASNDAPGTAPPAPAMSTPAPTEEAPEAEPGEAPSAANTTPPTEVIAEPVAATEGCCCQYSDPAGAGLRRFSTDQGRCEGAYYFEGCVDPGICEVASIPPTSIGELGVVSVSLPGGASARLKASPEHIFAHGQTVLYLPQPTSVVQARWINDLRLQGWTRQEAQDTPAESHGTVLVFTKSGSRLMLDLEGGCQGSKGTCVWLEPGVSAG